MATKIRKTRTGRKPDPAALGRAIREHGADDFTRALWAAADKHGVDRWEAECLAGSPLACAVADAWALEIIDDRTMGDNTDDPRNALEAVTRTSALRKVRP